MCSMMLLLIMLLLCMSVCGVFGCFASEFGTSAEAISNVVIQVEAFFLEVIVCRVLLLVYFLLIVVC